MNSGDVPPYADSEIIMKPWFDVTDAVVLAAIRAAWPGDEIVYADEFDGPASMMRAALEAALAVSSQSSDGGVEVRHAKTGNKAGSIPEEAGYPTATRIVREEVQGAAIQPCAGVTPGPSDTLSEVAE